MPHAKDKSKCQHAQIELRSTFFVYFDVTTSGHTRTPLDLCHTRQIHTIPQSEIPCCLTRTLWILGIPDWETRNALGPDSRPPQQSLLRTPQQCGREYEPGHENGAAPFLAISCFCYSRMIHLDTNLILFTEDSNKTFKEICTFEVFLSVVFNWIKRPKQNYCQMSN